MLQFSPCLDGILKAAFQCSPKALNTARLGADLTARSAQGEPATHKGQTFLFVMYLATKSLGFGLVSFLFSLGSFLFYSKFPLLFQRKQPMTEQLSTLFYM